jgi:hypothetical protein
MLFTVYHFKMLKWYDLLYLSDNSSKISTC